MCRQLQSRPLADSSESEIHELFHHLTKTIRNKNLKKKTCKEKVGTALYCIDTSPGGWTGWATVSALQVSPCVFICTVLTGIYVE